MEKKQVNEKCLSKMLMILVIVQPLIDIYRVFFGNCIEILGVSVVEVINIVCIGVIMIMFCHTNWNKKRIIPMVGYGIILLIYLIIHSYNITKFDTEIISGASINIIVELYYIGRVYILPLMMLYVMLFVRTTKDSYLNTIAITSFIISIVIVLTNLFKVSFVSYATYLEKNEFIQQNIFDWFVKKAPQDIYLSTSKGWFYSGNQIGLILLMTFPCVIYFVVYKNKKRYYSMIFFQMIAMIMVATKTAAFGAFLVLTIMIILISMFSVVEKKWKRAILTITMLCWITVCGVFILLKSPVIEMLNLQQSNQQITEEEIFDVTMFEVDEDLAESGSETEAQEENFDEERFIEFMNAKYYIYGVHEDYIKLLPVEKHTKFWYDVMMDSSKSQLNFRDFKYQMYEHVLLVNDNPLDKWAGIGYTTNFPYVEKDGLSQVVWFGSLGTILILGPYAVIFLYAAIRILLKFKKKFTLYHCALGLGICAAAMGAIIAGHLFTTFFAITLFSYMMGQLFQSACNDL